MLNTKVFFSGSRRNPRKYFCMRVLLEQNATVGFLTEDERLHNTTYRAISSWSPDPIYSSSSDSQSVVSNQNFNWTKHHNCSWWQWRHNLQIITAGSRGDRTTYGLSREELSNQIRSLPIDIIALSTILWHFNVQSCF